LLVPRTELEWARELLGVSTPPPTQPTPSPAAPATGPAPRIPLPVQYYNRPKSEIGYRITMALLILAMVFIVLVMILAMIFWN
jgi:hypothetical protein